MFLSPPGLQSGGAGDLYPHPFLYFLFRSISEMMNLIDKGVLPQDARPPEDILRQPSPSLVYLDWIDSLPGHLKYQVIYFSPSCSIKAQKEQVCLCRWEVASQRPRRTLGNVGHSSIFRGR